MNAKKGRQVTFDDLLGEFFHTLTNEKVISLLTGELCELVVKVNPKLYQKTGTTSKSGTPMLYVQL